MSLSATSNLAPSKKSPWCSYFSLPLQPQLLFHQLEQLLLLGDASILHGNHVVTFSDQDVFLCDDVEQFRHQVL